MLDLIINNHIKIAISLIFLSNFSEDFGEASLYDTLLLSFVAIGQLYIFPTKTTTVKLLDICLSREYFQMRLCV